MFMSLVHHLEGIELYLCFLKPPYCAAPCLLPFNSSSCVLKVSQINECPNQLTSCGI